MTSSSCQWTTTQAYSLSLVASLAYVLFLYLLVPTSVRGLPREDPTHIRYRLLAVTIAKVIIFAIAVAVVPTQSCLGISFWQTFGWDVNLNALFATLTTCGLMAVFYLGKANGIY